MNKDYGYNPYHITDPEGREICYGRRIIYKVLTAVVLVLSLFFFTSDDRAASIYDFTAFASERYVFGVVPQFEQRKLFAVWQPIIKELEKRTGLAFELVTTLNIRDFEKEFVRGAFDFVYINPYDVLMTITTQGYIPLVRDKAPLHGILIVRKDGPIRKVAELNGKVVAFPSPNSIGSLIIRADLKRLYHVSVEPLYVKTHSSVYLHVANGLADAGGGLEKTLHEQGEAIRNSLRIIYTTRDLPSHPVAAHPRVPEEQREKVRKALLDLGDSPEGREMLSRVPIKQIVAASIKDYAMMRQWGLENYFDAFWSED